MEKLKECMLLIEFLLECDDEQGLGFIEARNKWMETNFPNITDIREQYSKIHEASEILYDAYHAASKEDFEKCISEALSVSQYCIDAYVMLADSKESYNESIEALLKGFQKAMEIFSFSQLAENRGYLWGMIEYRPFMRLLHKLAEELEVMKMSDYSLMIYEFLHEFIENDNLGVRNILLNIYLKKKTLVQARSLLDRYQEYESIEFTYGEMLYHYLAGNLDVAEMYLKKGLNLNEYILDYIVFGKKMNSDISYEYSDGSVEEAMIYANQFKARWNKTRGLNDWVIGLT